MLRIAVYLKDQPVRAAGDRRLAHVGHQVRLARPVPAFEHQSDRARIGAGLGLGDAVGSTVRRAEEPDRADHEAVEGPHRAEGLHEAVDVEDGFGEGPLGNDTREDPRDLTRSGIIRLNSGNDKDITVSGGADQATTGLALGLRLPLIPGISDGFGDWAGETHELLVKITIALLVIHVAAALKHQFFDHSRAEGRMPPFRERDGTPTVPVE